MMRPTILLRIAAVLALIQYSAHAFLFLSHETDRGQLFGYGLLAILSGVIEIVLLWQLAGLAKTHADRIKPIIALFIFANVAHAILVWRYFHLAAPIIFDLAIAIVLAFAIGEGGSILSKEEK